MVDAVLGLQWGDEGKGKIVDSMASDYDIVARFQGGPNAGHTLIIGDQKHILHTIPSGILHPKTQNIIGNGVVIDPGTLQDELHSISAYSDYRKCLKIAHKAHLILPTHQILDQLSEKSKGKLKVGSTLRGIGPTYADKIGRNGLRIGDITSTDFHSNYTNLKEKHLDIIQRYYQIIDEKELLADISKREEKWFEGIELIKKIPLINCEYFINRALNQGQKILAEGAQGSLLDIDYGSYPYVTSSSTVSSGACIGLGIAPNKIGEVQGIFKAYTTRVGGGPFPTEQINSIGVALCNQGREYGATTGRQRRCGWLDLPLLKYSMMLNGVTTLCITKLDVLSGFDELAICTSYNINNLDTDEVPYDLNYEGIKPNYITLKGWKENLSNCNKRQELPQATQKFLGVIEREIGLPITTISVGADRNQTIRL